MVSSYHYQQMGKKPRPEWADAIRKRREQLGLTQEQLAEMSGVHSLKELFLLLKLA